MHKIFLHHRYLELPSRDLSGYGHHGTAFGLSLGEGALRNSAYFNGAGWIHLPVSSSMANISQFRASVVFRLADTVHSVSRMNLVEGSNSFAIFITPDRRVVFSLLDRLGVWTGCSTPPSIITNSRWHTLDIAHDGVSEARILLNGDLVASANNMFGPVRSVSTAGVGIGRWPDSPTYLFEGYISEVALYKFHPQPELDLLFGAACIDKNSIVNLFQRLYARANSPRVLEAWALNFQQLVTECAQATQRNDLTQTQQARSTVQAGVLALGSRNGASLTSAMHTLESQINRNLTLEQKEAFRTKFKQLRSALPVSDAELMELARALCIDKIIKK